MISKMKFILFFGFFCVSPFEFISASLPKLSDILLFGVNGLKTAINITPGVPEKVFGNCIEPPVKCPSKYVTFWYFSRNNPNNETQILDSDEGFARLPRSKHPWKVIIHGYTEAYNKRPNTDIRPAYFARGEYNIISVDYSRLARNKCYIQAVRNVPLIAKCTAQFLDRLIDKGYSTLDNLHIVGFSLGAQIAGRIHKYFKHGKPYRITGLDPAGPLFDNFINHRLTKKAGKFVDVIHTNVLVLGELLKSGHVDFYVNGGAMQPGCKDFGSRSIKSTVRCSHGRSPLYFAESINSPDGFWGIPCNFPQRNCNVDESQLVLMGEDAPRNASGIYYLNTNSQSPFALGKRTSYEGFFINRRI